MGERGVLRAGPVVSAVGLVAAVATLLWSSATGDVPFAAVLAATFVLVVSTIGLVLSLGIGTQRWTWVERWGGWVFAAVLGVLAVSNALDRNWVLASLAAVLTLLQVRAQVRRKRPAAPAQDWPVERVRETLSAAGSGRARARWRRWLTSDAPTRGSA
jgi:hypothetical protein